MTAVKRPFGFAVANNEDAGGGHGVWGKVEMMRIRYRQGNKSYKIVGGLKQTRKIFHC